MCGIVGIISNKNISSLENTVQEMNLLQIHRGPDGEGVWSSDAKNVLLAHRRLSIIDLSEAGIQPMTSYDERYVIVFNGEIYNFEDLKQKCIHHGSKFNSKTDTEVIMEYIRHFGTEAIKDLRGMWAFVMYDTKTNKAILSRDNFGIKPFHYGFNDGNLYFASEIKSLRCIDKHFSEVDEATEKLYLDYGYLDIGECTFFKNIKRFPQSHYAEIDLNKKIELNLIKYWEPSKESINISDKEAIKQLDLLLNKSIERHMISDVPIAFCLSGGLDSSTIVGVAATKAKKGQSLNTFTTHYPSSLELDETKWAKMAVEYCGTTPHWIEPTFEGFEEDFLKVLHYHDEPFVSTSIYAQSAIFKAINKSGIKVSLDGQGADELLAGYHSFYLIYLLSLIKEKRFFDLLHENLCIFIRFPTFFMKNIFKTNNQKLKYFITVWIKKLLCGFSTFIRKFLLKFNIKRLFINKYTRRIFRLLKKQSIEGLKIELSQTQEAVPPEQSKEFIERLSFINSLMTIDFQQYLINTLMQTSVPQLLRNGDRNSMKSSVESRVPFLDVDLVNFILSLPDTFKIRRAVTKFILRKVARKYLPAKLVDRKDKMGFPSPEKEWLSRAFGLNVAGPFSREFRCLVIEKWRSMISAK